MTSSSVVIVKAPSGKVSNIAELRELWRYRHLVRILIERNLRSRYKNSVLGMGWTLISPIIQVLVMTFAVGFILQSGPRNLGAYIFCATLPWTFFQTSVLDSATAVLDKLPLLKKIYFPREIPLIASVCQNFFQFLISLGLFIVYRWGLTTIFAGWPGLPPIEILWLPVIILDLFVLTLGVAFLICAANVFYEDVKFITSMLMGFVMYLLPIFYFAENVFYSHRLGSLFIRKLAYHLFLANPLAWIVTAFKQVFFGQAIISNRDAVHPLMSAPFDYRFFAIATFLCFAICWAGYAVFNSKKWKFTERP